MYLSPNLQAPVLEKNIQVSLSVPGNRVAIGLCQGSSCKVQLYVYMKNTDQCLNKFSQPLINKSSKYYRKKQMVYKIHKTFIKSLHMVHQNIIKVDQKRKENTVFLHKDKDLPFNKDKYLPCFHLLWPPLKVPPTTNHVANTYHHLITGVK